MPQPKLTVQQFNVFKRAIDLVVVIALSPLILTVMGLVAALVRWKTGSPVLFQQPRSGMNDKVFSVAKFRTMTDARDNDGNPLPDRERLTSVGHWLRRTSLDEVPQILNVLRGDMALVGPRPLPKNYSEWYTERERARLMVRPGLTGLAQVCGRNIIGWEQRLELDAQYVERRSLIGDIGILAHTIRVVLLTSGASVIASDTGEALNVERTYGRTDRVALRRLNRSDLAARVDWLDRVSTRKYMQLGSITVASTALWFEHATQEPHRFEFVLTELSTGRRLAMLGVKRIENSQDNQSSLSSGELYMVVNPDVRGAGFGRAAVGLLIDWLSRERIFQDVTLTVADANTAAVKIYEQLGFRTTAESDGRQWMSLRIEEAATRV